MDEAVWGFATENLPPMNVRERKEKDLPFLPNGSDPKAFQGAAFAQKKPDIAERGMDEAVWGFATENLPPMNVRERKEKDLPFLPNGSDPKAFQGAALAQRKPDISENNIDWDVHDFVYDHVTPLNTWERANHAYAPNGSSDRSFAGSAFSQLEKKDISENNVDWNLHEFVYDHVTPLNTWERSSYSYAPNGSSDKAF